VVLLAEDALDNFTARSCVVFTRMLECRELPFQLAATFRIIDEATDPPRD
jgi:hypothetical protein